MSTTPAPGEQGTAVFDPATCTKNEHCPPRCPRFIDKHGQPLLVRPYEDSEFEALVDFYDDYPERHRSMSLPPLTRTQIEPWLDRLVSRGKNIVAFDGDELVGHVAYTPEGADEPELIVFIDEEHQNRGLGTELCRQALAYAAATDHDAVKLSVDEDNHIALAVYDSLGFEEVGQDGRLIEMKRTFEEFPVVEPIAQLPDDC